MTKEESRKAKREPELEGEVARLNKEIARLKNAVKSKKFGLVWMDVPEQFEEEAENAMPVLEEVPEKAVVNKDGKPTHILIEGDNYHALTCLNYTHKGKIDVIYIDPPYNTGAKDWKYNNRYVDGNDPWRHSKWINLMANRLRIAKNLLTQNGVLICAIDENEQAALGLLLEDLFGNHEIHCITIVHNPRGIQGNNFSYTHEFAYFVFRKGLKVIGSKQRDEIIEEELRDHGGESLRTDARNCFYPILVRNNQIIGFGNVPDDSFHPKGKNVRVKDDIIQVWPIDSKGTERKWVFALQTVNEIKDKLFVRVKKNGDIDVFRRKETQNPRTVWIGKRYDASTFGSKIVNEITGTTSFPFPKSLYNTRDCLECVIKGRKDAIVLDYFAGSGTTAHALMELNKEDGGRRQCIVCTNNENNICEEITYPRIERVINGYPFQGEDKTILFEKKLNFTVLRKISKVIDEILAVKTLEGNNFDNYEVSVEDNHIRLIGTKNIEGKKEGLGGNLKYYRTAFIGKNNVLNATDADKVTLAHEAGELLALAENTLYKVEENDWWQVYENEDRYTAVYFREELVPHNI